MVRLTVELHGAFREGSDNSVIQLNRALQKAATAYLQLRPQRKNVLLIQLRVKRSVKCRIKRPVVATH